VFVGILVEARAEREAMPATTLCIILCRLSQNKRKIMVAGGVTGMSGE